MRLKDRFPDAQEIPSLEPEISFRIHDTFYYGPDSPVDGTDFERLVEKLRPPNIQCVSASAVQTTEVLGHESELVAYYQQIVRLARQYKRLPHSTSRYFELNLRFYNLEHGVDIPFLWYDSFGRVDGFLAAIIDLSSGLVYHDQDQGWGLELHAYDGFVYFKAWDPDTDGTSLETIVPRNELLAKITMLRPQTKQIISYLSNELGTDFWTSYAQEQALLRFKSPWWKFC